MFLKIKFYILDLWHDKNDLSVNLDFITHNTYMKSIRFNNPVLLKTLSLCFLLFAFTLTAQVKAQPLYQSIAFANLEVPNHFKAKEVINLDKQTFSQGRFAIKDGVLEDIHDFKFELISEQIKTVLANQLNINDRISFEKTHVMVLPMMGMVHFVGQLTIGDKSSRADFQLGYAINKDQSVAFKGEKLIKLNDFVKDESARELSLLIDFVLQNDQVAK